MSQLEKALQKVLRPEEVCHCVADAKFCKATGKRRGRTIAVVSNRRRSFETAIFALKAKRFQPTIIKGIYPVTKDFRVKSTGDYTFDIVYEAQSVVYSFECVSTSVMKELIVSMMTALKAARGHTRSSDAEAFAWTAAYTIVEDADQPMPYSPDFPATDASRQDISTPTLVYEERNNYLEASSILNVKEQWIEDQMWLRDSEFTEHEHITVFVGTWNVNGKEPREDLDEWLCVEGAAPEIYAIGFQELDLSAQTFFLNNSQMSSTWEEKIQSALAKMGKYMRVLTKQLVGMLLCVYVRAEHAHCVRNVQADMAGVGIMGMMGNKGGVAVRMTYLDSTICFVNSHLAARTDNVERRNADHKEICRRLAFRRDHWLDGQVEGSAGSLTVFDHDLLVWLGDLNYRLNVGDSEVKRRIGEKDWEGLLKHDQLVQQMISGLAFNDFVEAEIDFAPTYKYDPGTNRYDTSEKKRTPAWCDRVLWRTTDDSMVKPLVYARKELLTSDHKPVCALLDVRCKIIIDEKRHTVYHSIVRELDKMENDCMPDAIISSSFFEFGQVKFMQPVTKTFELTNTGQVVLQFSFITKPGDEGSAFCKPWLRVHPTMGIVLPGKSLTISMTLAIDADAAAVLNEPGRDASTVLEDILILHLENGKDYFVNVVAEYLRTCFACSITTLCCLSEPVRTADFRTLPSERRLTIPKELWRLVDFLYAMGADVEDLFLESGDPTEMCMVRDCLDTGADLRAFRGKAHAVAEALVRFLDSLPQPVIPFNVIPQCIECSQSAEMCFSLVSLLPDENYNVFTYVMAFLREMLTHAATNNLTIEGLAMVFSNVLLRERKRTAVPTADVAAGKTRFLLHFLDNSP